MTTKDPIPLVQARDEHDLWMIEMKESPEGTRSLIRGVYNTFARWIEERDGRVAMTSDWTKDNLEMYFRKYVSQFSAWDAKRSQCALVEKWLMSHEYLSWGPPIVEECIPKRGRTTPPRERRLSDDELLLLLREGAARHPRNYYMILFARLTGARIGAICALRWSDVLWDEGDVLWQNPKGSKGSRENQRMPLTPALRMVLEKWRSAYEAEVRTLRVRSDWFVFPATYATGLGRKGVRRPLAISPNSKIAKPNDIMTEALHDAGLWTRPGESWHILRKTAVNKTKQVASDENRGDAWEMAAAMAGHADIKTTKTYVNANEDYARYKAWAGTVDQLGPTAMQAIPALADLAPNAKKDPTPASDASHADPVYLDDNVISFASRRRAQAL